MPERKFESESISTNGKYDHFVLRLMTAAQQRLAEHADAQLPVELEKGQHQPVQQTPSSFVWSPHWQLDLPCGHRVSESTLPALHQQVRQQVLQQVRQQVLQLGQDCHR